MKFYTSGICLLITGWLCCPTNLVAQDSLHITKVFQWQDTTLPGSIYFNNTYNECWGLAIDNREYAIIGSTMGTHFFDITQPANAVEVDFVMGASTGNTIVHRDYHDYQNYLYMVTDEGTGTLQIVDLSFLPDSVALVYDSDKHFNRVHNIFIDSAKGRLYACSVDRDSGFFSAMEIYSLANPLNPAFLAKWTVPGHVHDAYVKNDTAYLNCGGDGLYIVDFSNVNQPAILGDLQIYPDQGYNHSGWLSEDGETYVFLDETPGMSMKICDASDVSSLSVKSLFHSGVDSASMAHNVIIKGNTAYISYYHDGLYMVDISDRSNPVLKGYYDTYLPAEHKSYKGAWGVYPLLPSGRIIVSDMQTGLYVFEYTGPTGSQSDYTPEMRPGIYPNPAINLLNIKFFASHSGPAALSIYNIGGQLVWKSTIENQQGENRLTIGLPDDLPDGLYVLYGGGLFTPVTFLKHNKKD